MLQKCLTTTKTVMNTAMGYALEKKMISVNPAEDVDSPKQKPKTEFRVRHIDEQKTLNEKPNPPAMLGRIVSVETVRI